LISGFVKVDDADGFVVTLFANLPASDRSYMSWQVFRNWTDTRHPVRREVVDRLIEFWRWRINELETQAHSDAVQEDLSGLTWLICTPQLPDDVSLELGLRTLEASRGQVAARGAIWERLRMLAEIDIDKTFRMVELIVIATLGRPYPHLELAHLEPILRPALASTSTATRENARRLVNTLGERGYIEFGRLLQTS